MTLSCVSIFYTAEMFILIGGLTFCTCISENNQMENGGIIMGFWSDICRNYVVSVINIEYFSLFNIY